MIEKNPGFPKDGRLRVTVDIGKIFLDGNGAGRLYIPRTIISAGGLRHKEKVRLRVAGGVVNATPLRRLK